MQANGKIYLPPVKMARIKSSATVAYNTTTILGITKADPIPAR